MDHRPLGVQSERVTTMRKLSQWIFLVAVLIAPLFALSEAKAGDRNQIALLDQNLALPSEGLSSDLLLSGKLTLTSENLAGGLLAPTMLDQNLALASDGLASGLPRSGQLTLTAEKLAGGLLAPTMLDQNLAL